MPFSKYLKLVFIHIPKCGGTSFNNMIIRAIRKTSNHHIDYILNCPNDMNDTSDHLNLRSLLKCIEQSSINEAMKIGYKFIILVRDPFTRILSYYRFLKQEKAASIERFASFEEFIYHLQEEHRLDLICNTNNADKRYHVLRSIKYFCIDETNNIRWNNSNIWYISVDAMNELIVKLNKEFPELILDIRWDLSSLHENSHKNFEDFIYFKNNPHITNAIKEVFATDISILSLVCPAALDKCREYNLL
jgi:hypothetical protein